MFTKQGPIHFLVADASSVTLLGCPPRLISENQTCNDHALPPAYNVARSKQHTLSQRLWRWHSIEPTMDTQCWNVEFDGPPVSSNILKPRMTPSPKGFTNRAESGVLVCGSGVLGEGVIHVCSRITLSHTFNQSWLNAGPTSQTVGQQLSLQWVKSIYIVTHSANTRPVLGWCWTGVVSGWQKLNQHWRIVSCLHAEQRDPWTKWNESGFRPWTVTLEHCVVI